MVPSYNINWGRMFNHPSFMKGWMDVLLNKPPAYDNTHEYELGRSYALESRMPFPVIHSNALPYWMARHCPEGIREMNISMHH